MDSIIQKEDIRFTKLKNINKVQRSINQSLALILMLLVFFRAVFNLNIYEPYDAAAADAAVDNGFLCLAYNGVDTVGSQTLISDDRLEEHLRALKNSGYVTISQQDVLDYIHHGKPLPARALFLMFSDGTRDTAIFAQKIMEEQNMLASMFTYANKFESRDNKSLMGKEVKLLEETTFWETGSNGYRLSFINCFDRFGTYLGELDSAEFSRVGAYIDKTYDHYLMDYLRDEYGVPKESYEEMEARIQSDYASMEALYGKELGHMPRAYAIMHANTGAFGSNAKASAVNEQQIKRLFHMNFNRVDDAKNTRDTDIYDLTRMEPKAHWSVNHLLMRLWDSTGLAMAFETGVSEKAFDWKLASGAAACEQQQIIVTSPPRETGAIKLKKRSFANMALSVQLLGNQVGTQRILLRADDRRRTGAAVELTDNVLYLYNLEEGRENSRLILDMDLHDGIMQLAPEAAREQALQAEIEAIRSDHEGDKEQRIAALLEAAAQPGAQPKEKEIDPDTAGNRRVQLFLTERYLSVWIDGKLVIEHQDMGELPKSGFLWLESASSLSNAGIDVRDSVYDGRFQDLYITDTQTDAFLYDYRPDAKTLQKLERERRWTAVVDWFIKIL